MRQGGLYIQVTTESFIYLCNNLAGINPLTERGSWHCFHRGKTTYYPLHYILGNGNFVAHSFLERRTMKITHVATELMLKESVQPCSSLPSSHRRVSSCLSSVNLETSPKQDRTTGSHLPLETQGVYWASNSSYWSWAQWTLRGCSQPPTTCGWDMSLETFYYRTHPWSEYKEGWGTGWGQLSRTAAQILPFRPGSIFGWNRFEIWDHTGNTDLWGWGERASARDRTLAFNLSRSKWIEPGYQPTSLQYSGLKRWEISELHTLPSE